MYRRSNMSLTLSFIHLVSSMLVSYNIYVNILLFENENSIIFCKQSVSFICLVYEAREFGLLLYSDQTPSQSMRNAFEAEIF